MLSSPLSEKNIDSDNADDEKNANHRQRKNEFGKPFFHHKDFWGMRDESETIGNP
jgi:hypothetical protein